MRRLKKNLKYKYGVFLIKRLIGFKRLRYTFLPKIKMNFFKKNSDLYVTAVSVVRDLLPFHIKIRVVSNNIFCYLMDTFTNEMLVFGTAGMYNVNVSKKNLKFFLHIILKQFFQKCSSFLQSAASHTVFFTLDSPMRVKKLILKTSSLFFKKTYNVVLNLTSIKCFNGCRQRKSIRRKRRMFRIYKNV